MRYLERLGHLSLADGSLLRLDAECGQYVASRYVQGPGHLVLSSYTFGSFDTVVAVAAAWVDAFELSVASAAVGVAGRPGAVQSVPAPGQLSGEVA